jgi:DNA-binding protein YbaB
MWSRGLKDLFGLRDKTDDEILEETTEEAKQIDTVADMVFSLLVKYKKLAEYLNAVECDILHGTFEVKRILDSVVDQEIVILEEMVLQSERRGQRRGDEEADEAVNDCNAQMNIFSFG